MMNLSDIFKFQFKRVNPFPGLAIDADTWRDAHNYSRDQQRLHNLVFHQMGIVEGLGVTENDPPDLSVNIQPGIAIDPEGNTIIVRNVYHYKIQNRDPETIYLIIQFREILEGPYQPPEGGQPTRIIDGYRIQERDTLPDEPYLELARIELDPAKGIIRNAESQLKPGKNEINLNSRNEVKQTSANIILQRTSGTPAGLIDRKSKILIGQAAVNGTDRNLHLHGLRNLVRDMEMHYNRVVELVENVNLEEDIEKFALIYLAGNKGFKLNENHRLALDSFFNSNGVLFAEDCGEEVIEGSSKSKSRPVYDELVDKLKIKLKPIHQGDRLLSNINVFSEIPEGVKSGEFLVGENIIYSNNDYGCAWQGGYKGNPISRNIIRSAFEIGVNIVDHAYQTKLSVNDRTLVTKK